mgnify:CR=1 FL=1
MIQRIQTVYLAIAAICILLTFFLPFSSYSILNQEAVFNATGFSINQSEFTFFPVIVNIGASVLEWAWIAAGRGQVYLHGGMKLWDLAAGSLILSEAGGFSCTLDEDEVFKPTMKPRSVLISHDRELFMQWKNFILILLYSHK